MKLIFIAGNVLNFWLQIYNQYSELSKQTIKHLQLLWVKNLSHYILAQKRNAETDFGQLLFRISIRFGVKNSHNLIIESEFLLCNKVWIMLFIPPITIMIVIPPRIQNLNKIEFFELHKVIFNL